MGPYKHNYNSTLLQDCKYGLILVRPTCFETRPQNQPKMEIWQGCLAKEEGNKNKMFWKNLALNYEHKGPIFARCNPICFFLKDDLYITGGFNRDGYSLTKMGNTFASCDRYNFVKEKFYHTRHCLPYHIDKYTSSVIANMEETLVLIYTKENDYLNNNNRQEKLIIFTEKRGFEDISYIFSTTLQL